METRAPHLPEMGTREPQTALPGQHSCLGARTGPELAPGYPALPPHHPRCHRGLAELMEIIQVVPQRETLVPSIPMQVRPILASLIRQEKVNPQSSSLFLSLKGRSVPSSFP